MTVEREPGIRHYRGSATYRQMFDMPKISRNQTLERSDRGSIVAWRMVAASLVECPLSLTRFFGTDDLPWMVHILSGVLSFRDRKHLVTKIDTDWTTLCVDQPPHEVHQFSAGTASL